MFTLFASHCGHLMLKANEWNRLREVITWLYFNYQHVSIWTEKKWKTWIGRRLDFNQFDVCRSWARYMIIWNGCRSSTLKRNLQIQLIQHFSTKALQFSIFIMANWPNRSRTNFVKLIWPEFFSPSLASCFLSNEFSLILWMKNQKK